VSFRIAPHFRSICSNGFSLSKVAIMPRIVSGMGMLANTTPGARSQIMLEPDTRRRRLHLLLLRHTGRLILHQVGQLVTPQELVEQARPRGQIDVFKPASYAGICSESPVWPPSGLAPRAPLELLRSGSPPRSRQPPTRPSSDWSAGRPGWDARTRYARVARQGRW